MLCVFTHPYLFIEGVTRDAGSRYYASHRTVSGSQSLLEVVDSAPLFVLEHIRFCSRREIKTFREAKEMIELDIYLSKTIDQQPEFGSMGEDKLSEEMAEKVDRIMEFIRKKAMESCKGWK